MQTAVRATLVVLATAMMSACGSGGPSKTPPFGDYLPGDFNSGGDTMNPACGNGRIEGAEVCDGANLDNQTCETRGFAGGILRCSSNCTDFDISGCTTCGNDSKDAGEVCDGADLGGATCLTLGYEGGTLECNRSCDDYNTEACLTTASCGDGVATDPEICDGSDLRGKSCRTLGFESGTLGCSQNCDAFDTSECESNADCGNDTIETPEVCDGTDLGGEDCTTQGYASGALACNASCTGFNFAGCVAATCGNGIQEPGEPCDGSDLGNETCVTRGFISGTLACDGSCNFDTSGCTGTPVCGNDVLEGLELCDTDQLGGQTCQSLGFREGTLACSGTCEFDTSNCSGEQQGMCGNGVINGVEFCDGDAWMYGADCAGYNMGTGTVVCTGDCQPDFTGCTNPDLCDANGWYGDGYCDACDLLNGTEDPDCANLCPQSDGECVSYYGTLTGVFTCQHAGYTDPDCGSCGDGVTEEPEWCDGDDLAGLDCTMFGFIGGAIACADDCTADLSGCINPVCGNDLLEGQEMCDGADLGGLDCTDLGFASGTLGCQTDCQDFDTGRCEGATCGNSTLEVGEVCEIGDLGGTTCETLGLSGSGLACANDCLSFDPSACSPRATAFTCGDEEPNGLEVCEGTEYAFGTGECVDLGLTSGSIACTASCMADLNACLPTDFCDAQGWYGDGYCDACEAFPGGTVDPDCTTYCTVADGFCADYFDTLSQSWTCRSKGLIDPDCGACGNDIIDGSEYCDGSDLGLLDCTGFGFLSGSIACAADCTPDFTLCLGPVCGDGIISEGEACDKGGIGGATENLDGLSCNLLGFSNPPGALACADDCRTYDLTGCEEANPCGNGNLDPGEVCDGTDFGGATCASLGAGISGTLACVTCTDIDTSACTGGVLTCGDGVVNGAEWCDGDDWVMGPDCADFAMGNGVATCTALCTVDFAACDNPDLCAAQNWYNDGYCDACDLLGGTVDPDCGLVCEATDGVCADYYDAVVGVWTCSHLGLVDPDCGTCGNGSIDGNEYCDGNDLDGYGCLDYGFGDGTLACATNCIPDFSGCGAVACGNDVAEGNEWCDGTDLLGLDCTDFGFTGGTLGCLGDCTDFDTSSCSQPASTLCGDGEANGIEWCDTSDWITGPDCADFGLGTGTATCTAACAIDFAGCDETDFCAGQSPSWYGDGVCDPCDLMGGTVDPDCETLCVAADGTCEDYFDAYAQAWTCSHLDLVDPDCGTCGDDVVEGNEWCDGTVTTEDCTDYGFASGALDCTELCLLDFDACVEASCGNGTIDGSEVCDGSEFGGETCESQGYLGGTLACIDQCMTIDTTSCVDGTDWTCNPSYYDDGSLCDCGCGLLDPDCTDATLASCDFCNMSGSCSDESCTGNTQIDPSNNAVCSAATWNCNAAYYDANDGCDCGCGIFDPDCLDATVDSCDYCTLSGSCATTDCSEINASDNAVCGG